MSYLTDIRSALMSCLPEPFVTAARRRMIVYRGRRAHTGPSRTQSLPKDSPSSRSTNSERCKLPIPRHRAMATALTKGSPPIHQTKPARTRFC